jgi:phosphatidate cytidylyltransferase
MRAHWQDIATLALVAVVVLLALTILGEVLRARRARSGGPQTDPALDLYMTRLDSWWAMVVLFTLALLAGPWAVVALFAVASFAALREFYTFSDHAPADHRALAAAFYLVLPLQFLFVAMDWQRLFGAFVPVYVFLLLPVLSVLRGDARRFLARVSETQWGLMICVFCLSHIPALMWLGEGMQGQGGRGMLLIAFLIVVVQAGDLVDFFVGRRFGRRRIVAALSPKTWEGAAAGLLTAAVLGAVLARLTPFGVPGAMAMAAVAAFAGQCGTLVLAAIKRDKGLRDWSHLIPGQGGFLNQLDSTIFAAPIFFHLTRLWWLP